MNILNIKKILLGGGSLLCIMFAQMSHAESSTKFPQISISGLSKFQGQYVTVLFFKYESKMMVVDTNLKIDSLYLQLGSISTAQDVISIPSQSIPKKGFSMANAVKIIIHPGKEFNTSGIDEINDSMKIDRKSTELEKAASESSDGIVHLNF